MAIEYGLQLYSMRDTSKTDLRGTLEKVAEMGYKYVEFAGFFDNSAEDVKSWLDEYGLIASGTHTGLAEILPEKIDETIAYHKAIGCDNLIVPGANWGTKESFESNIKALQFAEKKLKENGIRLGYHNHSGEFFETPYGEFIEKAIIERTGVELEIDTFWTFNAGLDSVALCESLKDRIRVIHLKDGIPAAESNRNFEKWSWDVKGKSLGQGKAPVTAVREWAIKNNVLMVVESEGLDPTGAEEVKRCIDYLRSLEA